MVERRTDSRVKSIYFPLPEAEVDAKGKTLYGRVVALAFILDRHQAAWDWIKLRGSDELREFFGIKSYPQLEKLAKKAKLSPGNYLRERVLEHVSNLETADEVPAEERKSIELRTVAATEWSAPFRGLAPNIEDTPDLIRRVLSEYAPGARRLLDPFAGTGNVPIVAAQQGLLASYCEIDPLFRAIINVKVDLLTRTFEGRQRVIGSLFQLGGEILRYARDETFPLVVSEMRSAELARLGSAARAYIDSKASSEPLTARCAELLVAAALGRMDDRDEDDAQDYFAAAIETEVQRMARFVEESPVIPDPPQFVCDDVRDLRDFLPRRCDVVFTSPPPLQRHGSPPPKLQRAFLRMPSAGSFPDTKSRDALREIYLGRSRAVAWPDEPGMKVLEFEDRRRGVRDTLRKIDREVSPRAAREAAAHFLFMAGAIEAVEFHLERRATVIFDVSTATMGGVPVDLPGLLMTFLEYFGFHTVEDVQLGRRVTTRGDLVVKDRLMVARRA